MHENELSKWLENVEQMRTVFSRFYEFVCFIDQCIFAEWTQWNWCFIHSIGFNSQQSKGQMWVSVMHWLSLCFSHGFFFSSVYSNEKKFCCFSQIQLTTFLIHSLTFCYGTVNWRVMTKLSQHFICVNRVIKSN